MENEIIYGRNAVEAILKADKRNINKVYLAKGIKFDPKIKSIIDEAKNAGIPIQEVPKEKLNTLAPGVHQGIAVSVSPIEYMEFDTLEDKLLTDGNHLLVILDGVEDPHNLGAIIRTACAAGADAVIIPKRRASTVTATVEKASAGTVEQIPIVQVNNITATIEKLKDKNFWIFGAEGSSDTNYYDANFKGNCAIVMGGEDKGISTLVRKNCDVLVKIPMPGNINSLNVSNAASIIIFEAVKQRLKGK